MVYEELPQVAIKISPETSPDTFSILIRSSNQITGFLINLTDQEGNEINGMSIAPGGVAPPNVVGGTPTIAPAKDGEIEIAGNAIDSPIPPLEEFTAFINIQLTEDIPAQVCFGNVTFLDAGAQVEIFKVLCHSMNFSLSLSFQYTLSLIEFDTVTTLGLVSYLGF